MFLMLVSIPSCHFEVHTAGKKTREQGAEQGWSCHWKRLNCLILRYKSENLYVPLSITSLLLVLSTLILAF